MNLILDFDWIYYYHLAIVVLDLTAISKIGKIFAQRQVKGAKCKNLWLWHLKNELKSTECEETLKHS